MKSNDTGLNYDSNESDETCGARWDHVSMDGSEQIGRKRKRKRTTSSSSLHSNTAQDAKRAKAKSIEDNNTVATHSSHICNYLSTSTSPGTFDVEDGYDGASELRSFDGDFIDDHTTDNEVNNAESLSITDSSVKAYSHHGTSPDNDSLFTLRHNPSNNSFVSTHSANIEPCHSPSVLSRSSTHSKPTTSNKGRK